MSVCLILPFSLDLDVTVCQTSGTCSSLFLILVRARWFQLFVMESFGELSYSAGYRKKHSRLYGFGVGGLLYPAQALPIDIDRILYRGQKTGFWVSCCLNLIWCLLYPPNPPQLPRETLWTGWKRSWVRPTPPTNAHMVTENCPHWEETSKTRFVLFFYLFSLN